MRRAIAGLLTVSLVALACGAEPDKPADRRSEDAGGEDETVYAGVATSRSVLELDSGLRITADGALVTQIEFDVALAAGAQPMSITGPNGHIEMAYIDAVVSEPALAYFARESVGDGDGMLESDESATIRIDMEDACPSCAIGPARTFTLELKPANGSYLVIQRTTPSPLPTGSIDLR
jgi:archaellin